MKALILNETEWCLHDEDVKAAYGLACGRFKSQGLTAIIKMEMSEILDTDPWVVQAWIDSKTSEQISEIL